MQTIADLQPVILISMLIVMYGLENIRPYLPKAPHQRRHDLRNLTICAINFAINGAVGLGVVASLEWTAMHHAGLLNAVALPTWVSATPACWPSTSAATACTTSSTVCRCCGVSIGSITRTRT
jgi:hypothetical protein